MTTAIALILAALASVLAYVVIRLMSVIEDQQESARVLHDDLRWTERKLNINLVFNDLYKKENVDLQNRLRDAHRNLELALSDEPKKTIKDGLFRE